MARKILLADDSVTAQNMGRKILTDAGYDVITVNNGSAALKRVAEQKPDLIVLDVYMPGYSGLEVCVRLKDAPETERIPILLTVGKLEPFKPEEANRVRADGYIVKPFEASELLSALARLEDRMVPAQAEGARFSGSVSGVERFGADPTVNKSADSDNDSGWKNRLRFPSKKKKEESEPEPEPDFVTPSSFRDFRRGNGKAPAGSPFPLSTAPSGSQEPGLVPDIPRDITPEELDALSELVAKLDGVPAPENVTAIGEEIGPAVPASETIAPEARAQETIAQVETIEAQAPIAPAPEEIKRESEVAAAELAKHEESKNEVVETPLAASPVETTPAVAESAPVEAVAPEATIPDAVAYPTETAVAQEPAPIDRDDEPMFVSAASAAQQAPSTELPVESPAAEEPIAQAQVEQAAVDATSEIAAHTKEPRVADSSPAEESSPAVAAHSAATGGAEASSPSAEELAEALRFLTPAQAPAAHQTLAEAGAALANELSRSSGSQWVAEAVPLSPEEAAGSLEAEMFRTFASPDSQPVAAVEVSGTESPAEVVSSTPIEASPTPAATEQALAPEHMEPEPSHSSAKQSHTDEAPEESSAPTTFADAIGREEDSAQDGEEDSGKVESVRAAAETVSAVTAETETREQRSSSENGPGGEEDMSKETKGKGGKSTWNQFRSGAPAPASNPVEAVKQSEETPKTMAAAASAESGADASSIASIVDNVLADLRPKIVEEIARQLAKK